MKKLLTLITLLLTITLYGQTVKIDSTTFTIKHGELTFYLDQDTNSYVSVHNVKYSELKKITGERSDKWHKEKPMGPYHKDAYVNTGYDLGHLTPSNVTSYDDSLNYHSFSLFNQAPQLAAFNRGKWAHLEANVIKTILTEKSDAIIVTGVLYENSDKEYLSKSRIKIPFVYYKILVCNGVTTAWIGSNTNGLITDSDVKTVLDIAHKNGNHLGIAIK